MSIGLIGVVGRLGLIRSQGAWWRQSPYLLDGASPDIDADFSRQRYMLSGAVVPLSSIISLSSTTKWVVGANGLLQQVAINTPAFDYSTGRRRLLLEPASATNLVASEDLTTSGWSTSGALAVASPSTMLGRPAWRLYQSTASVYQSRFAQPTAAASTTYTRSVYLKADGHRWVYLQQFDGVTNLGAFFDLQNGVLGTVNPGITARIEATREAGVYRCSVTYTTAASANKERLQIALASGNNATATYAGDGVSGVLVMGPQLEAGAVATSYIPTTGSAVTRSADDLRLTATLVSWFSGTGITVAVRGRAASLATPPIILGTDAGLRLAEITATGQLMSSNGSATLTATTGGALPTTDFGAVITHDASSRRAALTGGAVAADTAGWGATPAALRIGGTIATTGGPMWLDEIEIWRVGGTAAAVQAQARAWV